MADKSLFHYRFLSNPTAKGPWEWQHQVPGLSPEGSNFLQDMEATYDYAMLVEKVLEVDDDLKTIEEARSYHDWPKWKNPMEAEILQLENLGTYIKDKTPKYRVEISCKWVLGNIVHYKAKLVAKGFSQIPGIDFFEM